MNTVYSIILSAAIALFYTVIGGLYSVAYTGETSNWLRGYFSNDLVSEGQQSISRVLPREYMCLIE